MQNAGSCGDFGYCAEYFESLTEGDLKPILLEEKALAELSADENGENQTA